MFIGESFCFIIGHPPYFTPDFIKGFHDPFNDMELIDAALAIGSEILDAF